MTSRPTLHTVILAGGSGTRFWPASRRMRPKQLLPLVPGEQQSLLAQTVERLAPLCPPERFVIATGEHLVAASREALPQLPAEAFLAEPAARNTAPCIGLATSRIARHDPEATVVVVPSDHHITAPEAFRACLATAVESARSGTITTLGIRPTRPETGYGYIELGEQHEQGGWYRVKRFVEKPDRERAQRYLESGRFLWNAGMFVFRAATMLEAIETHLPALHEGLRRIEQAHATGGPEEEAKASAEVFAGLEPISIDYGVMEKVARLHVVPGEFGWSDLGSWQAAWDLAPKDAAGNSLPAGSHTLEASGNLAVDAREQRGERPPRVYALLGVEGLCIVETDEVTLIVPRERAQEVATLRKQFEDDGRRDLL